MICPSHLLIYIYHNIYHSCMYIITSYGQVVCILQLLMKATQLDSILRDYEHTEEQKAIMGDTISKKKDVCALISRRAE